MIRLQRMFPSDVSILPRRGNGRSLVRLQGQFSVSVLVAPHARMSCKRHSWRVKPAPPEKSNVTLLCLLKAANSGFQAFYVLPNVEESTTTKFGQGSAWLARGRKLER